MAKDIKQILLANPKMNLETFLIEYAEKGWKLVVTNPGHGSFYNFECYIYDEHDEYLCSYDECDGFEIL